MGFTWRSLALVFAVLLMIMAADGPMGFMSEMLSVGHSEGACQDPDCGGVPCGPGCPCACCPGHHVFSSLFEQSFSLEEPSEELTVAPAAETPCQKEIPSTIFRPPRS